MWSIRFAVFRFHEYCFLAYILTIIIESSFFILFSAKGTLLFMINSISCMKFSSTYSPIKIKAKRFRISYCNNIFFHDYNYLIKLLGTFSVILLCWWKDIVFVWFDFLIYWIVKPVIIIIYIDKKWINRIIFIIQLTFFIIWRSFILYYFLYWLRYVSRYSL